MDYIDTHCHLNFPQFRRDMEKTILRSTHSDLIFLINIGTDFATSQESINLASRFNEIYASVGVHPHDARSSVDEIESRLPKLIKSDKVVAVGEIGLDYYRNLSKQDVQKEAFIKQLHLAKEHNLPIILHCRDAYRDLLNILDEHYLPLDGNGSPGVIHSFSSGPAYLQEFLRRGFYIGFNGMITYPGNANLQAAVENTPLDKILIETDAPYLPPQSHRGERNEPAFVKEVVEKIAEIKNIPIEEVAKKTTANAIKLFGLK
ncbi:MAG: TatD family hydrolase [Patescibacteria group bacterium]|nr:TatD family hydrolase [Patescibacteria group bacterium]